MKPGYQTSEFYVVLITHLLAIATLFGVSHTVDNGTVQAIATVASLLASALAARGYSANRTALKVATTQTPPVSNI